MPCPGGGRLSLAYREQKATQVHSTRRAEISAVGEMSLQCTQRPLIGSDRVNGQASLDS